LSWAVYLRDGHDSGGGGLSADESDGAGGDEGGGELHIDGGVGEWWIEIGEV